MSAPHRLTVWHQSVYRYSEPVRFGEHRMMFRPRASHDLRLLTMQLLITPTPERLHWLHDVFDNSVAVATFSAEASELLFRSEVTLEHWEAPLPDYSLEAYASTWPFAYTSQEASDLVNARSRQYPDAEVDLWARRFIEPGGTTGTMTLLRSMTLEIKNSFMYVRRTEKGVNRPAETLRLRCGSCRDFAVLMMDAVRSLGLAARFVSGYIFAPGRYRSYLAPAALAELLSVTAWTGFSARAQASSRSELYKLHVGEIEVDPRVTISEDLDLGITPGFNDDGYLRESVPLIQAGRSAERLTNARSAREYGLMPNGALANESPAALSMQAGDLLEEDVLAKLDTGLYIGNLWYVNFSDRMNCRLTGMTRFATFWVENGQIVAPLEAMRFDDSLYRLLGSELEQLGSQAELLLSDSTWGERATGGMQLPGILTRSFELTL